MEHSDGTRPTNDLIPTGPPELFHYLRLNRFVRESSTTQGDQALLHMSSRRLCLQAWRLQRLRSVQNALRPRDERLQHLAQSLRVQRPCQRYYSSQRDEDFTVREFVRKSPDSDEVEEVDPNAGNKIEAELLKSEVEQLKKEIEHLQEGPFSPNGEFMQALPADLRAKALKALEEHGYTQPARLNVPEDITDEDFDRIVAEGDNEIDNPLQVESGKPSPSPSINLSLPRKSKAYITQFNRSLQRASEKDADEISQTELWRSYLRCRTQVPGFLEMVSDEVWDVLWISQSHVSERVKHLVVLAEDALESGNLLTGPQWVDYLQCLHASGKSEVALEKWKEVRDVLEAEPRSKTTSRDLGVRLHAANGQAEEALHMVSAHSDISPRVLLPIITAFARQQTQPSASKAWALYLRLKSSLASQMKMSDYEEISTSLLAANKPDLALAVFKDLLLSQEASSNDSLSLYKKAQGYVQDLNADSITEEDVNRISLSVLTVLPRSFQNKYFYASWIKKLIGLHQVEAASTVVELMYARGIKPDAKHLNGIIAAWLRQGKDTSNKKAEAMAWSMVEKRIHFARRRTDPPQEPRSKKALRIAIERPIPTATAETFSILLQHYLGLGNLTKAEHLMVGLEIAEIKPNTFIYNQWILSYRRKSWVDKAWKTYITLVEDGVSPDLETFAHLFDCGKIRYNWSQSITTPQFPPARTLFSEMVAWMERLPPRGIREASEQFTRYLYDQILRCFCLSHDLRGTLCVMHGLKQLFGTHPDANIARMVLLSVSRYLGADDVDGSATTNPAVMQVRSARAAARRRSGRNPKASLSKVAALLTAIADRKAMKSYREGVDPETVEDQRKAEIQLEILTEFLVIALARSVPQDVSPNPAELKDRILRVAESMGVREVNILWDEIAREIGT